MNNYVSPVIFDNEDLAEGVYATGSGLKPNGRDGTCWTVGISNIQKNAGNHSVTEIWAKHSTEVLHISNYVEIVGTLTVLPGQEVTDVRPEQNSNFTIEYVPGSTTFTIKRTLLADSYKSGDDVTFKVLVYSTKSNPSDPNSDCAYVATVGLPKCGYAANVQGEGGNGD